MKSLKIKREKKSKLSHGDLHQDLVDINLKPGIHEPLKLVGQPFLHTRGNRKLDRLVLRLFAWTNYEFNQSKAIKKNKGAISDKISALKNIGFLAMKVKEGFKLSHWFKKLLYLISLKSYQEIC